MAYRREEKKIPVLKILFYTIVITLLSGLIFTIYVIYKRNYAILFNNINTDYDNIVTHTVKNNNNTKCLTYNLPIDIQGKVKQFIASGEQLLIITESSDKTKDNVFIVDYCYGKILGNITINNKANNHIVSNEEKITITNDNPDHDVKESKNNKENIKLPVSQPNLKNNKTNKYNKINSDQSVNNYSQNYEGNITKDDEKLENGNTIY